MQYLYTLKARYGVVHVDLGPIFMVSRLHLRMLWRELREFCDGEGARDGHVQVIVERRTRLRDLRADEGRRGGDLFCALEARGLRVVFALSDEDSVDALDEFAALAQAMACPLRRFATLGEALAWAGLDEGRPASATADGVAATAPARARERPARGQEAPGHWQIEGWPAFA